MSEIRSKPTRRKAGTKAKPTRRKAERPKRTLTQSARAWLNASPKSRGGKGGRAEVEMSRIDSAILVVSIAGAFGWCYLDWWWAVL